MFTLTIKSSLLKQDVISTTLLVNLLFSAKTMSNMNNVFSVKYFIWITMAGVFTVVWLDIFYLFYHWCVALAFYPDIFRYFWHKLWGVSLSSVVPPLKVLNEGSPDHTMSMCGDCVNLKKKKDSFCRGKYYYLSASDSIMF